MGRSPCCEKVGLKKGPWTPEEDQKLLAYIEEHGHGSWRALPAKSGLQRCGKSCRLRWTNYLRPDIKRGKFNLQEEQTIIQLHALLGNRWSAIATHLPKRTDNEIKNYWNTHLKKRLTKMGIDPVTHKPKNKALSSIDGESKNTANLSHMAQWESARLEAEARLVRESKLRSSSFQNQLGSSGSTSAPASSSSQAQAPALCLDVLKTWQGAWSKSAGIGSGRDLESPTSTLSFSENLLPNQTVRFSENPTVAIEFMGNSGVYEGGIIKDEGEENSMIYTTSLHDVVFAEENPWSTESSKTRNRHVPVSNFIDGFTDLLLHSSGEENSPEGRGDSGNAGEDYEENKNYWDNILNLVNYPPSDSPVF